MYIILYINNKNKLKVVIKYSFKYFLDLPCNFNIFLKINFLQLSVLLLAGPYSQLNLVFRLTIFLLNLQI